jgi:hypothetical protein
MTNRFEAYLAPTPRRHGKTAIEPIPVVVGFQTLSR